MTYQYTLVNGHWLPVLRVGLHLPNGYTLQPMLVDSGSTHTLLPASLLQEFGAEFDDEAVEMTGVGSEFTGRRARIGLSVEGKRYPSEVIAVDDAHLTVALLGHDGFFDHFRVTFDSAVRTFSLRAT